MYPSSYYNLNTDISLTLSFFILNSTAFKQQNAVHGLPLQLCPEEVTLALEEGWAVLYGPVVGDTDTLDKSNDSKNKKRKAHGRYHYNEEEEEEDDFGDDDDGYYYQHHSEEEEEREKKVAPWQDALANGTLFEIPTTAEEAVAVQGDGISEDAKKVKRAEVHWTFPSTIEERDRYLVFKDLHSRGFRITGGSKFGSDYLLYPGDASLYHAQFGVRLMQSKECILPALMASACRGSFQARKHLLYASIVMKNKDEQNAMGDGGDVVKMLKGLRGKYDVQYMTFGPVDGFGKD